jgi:hypothetical protein
MPRSKAAVVVSVFAAAALIVSVVPATAASSNCAVLLVPGSVDPSGTILATEVDLGCYPTYAEALAAGSSVDRCPGRDDARLADRCPPRGRHDRDHRSRRPDRDRVHRHRLRWLVEELLRVGDMLHGGSVGRRGRRRLLGQRVQFGEGFGGSDTNKKFENTNFGGSVLTCTPNCTNYGTLSNQVSSLRWKP